MTAMEVYSMSVDPSLARDLRRTFWKHTNAQALQTKKAVLDVFKSHKSTKPFSQKGFRRFADDLIQRVPASSLILTKLEGRRQFVACIVSGPPGRSPLKRMA